MHANAVVYRLVLLDIHAQLFTLVMVTLFEVSSALYTGYVNIYIII